MQYTTPYSCGKKKSYGSLKEAANVIKHWHRPINKHYDTINAYQCNICNKFHVGHKYKRTDHKFQNLIDSLMKNINEGVS